MIFLTNGRLNVKRCKICAIPLLSGGALKVANLIFQQKHMKKYPKS